MDLASFIPALIEIAQSASEEILHIYQNEDLFAQQQQKADASPLTLADQASHQYIVERLRALRPDIPVLSEEGKSIPYSSRSDWPLFWLVDPLDGTREFIKRNGEFTVNIALIKGQQPVLGVLHVPVSHRTYYAARGAGAVRLEADGTKEVLQTAAFDKNSPGLRVVCSRSHPSPALQQFLDQLQQPVTLPMGSSLKFMLLAEGKADLYPRLGPTMEWDTAAAQIILEEAGGQVLNYSAFTPLLYNKPSLRNPHFIATGSGKW